MTSGRHTNNHTNHASDIAGHESPAYHVKTSIDDELDASATGKGDPLGEWASSTLNALGPVLDEPYVPEEPVTQKPETVTNMGVVDPRADSAVSTPVSVGHLVPGAFPRSNSELATEESQYKYQKRSEANAETTTSALETPRDNAAHAEGTADSAAAHLPVLTESSQETHTNSALSPESASNTNSDLTPAHKSKEHPVSPLESSSHGADSIASDSVPKRESTHPQTETMREGGGIVKGKESAAAETTQPPKQESEHPDRPTPGGVESSWDEYRTRESHSEAGGADTDASTRSLAGTQINRSLYTPGTSLFSGKIQDESGTGSFSATGNNESGASANMSRSESASVPAPDSQAPSATGSTAHALIDANAHHPHQPVHHEAPVTKGREHPLATEIGRTSSDAETVEAAPSTLTPAETYAKSETRPSAAPTQGETVYSSIATPGHGPPPVPHKEFDESVRRSSELAGVKAVAPPAAAAGAAAGGDQGGAGANEGVVSHADAAAPATPEKTAVAGETQGKPENVGESHHEGTEGKKLGFLEKLKRTFGGKHHHHHKEDEVKKD